MKTFFVSAVFAILLAACKNTPVNDTTAAAQSVTDSANYTSIQWFDSAQNLGALAFGDKKSIRFHFRNTGNKPLFIVSAIPGCGCTVADFPKGAIAPGEKGEIVAEFDTNKSNPGHFNKAITVVTNTTGSNSYTLTFEGEILENKKTAAGKTRQH